MQTQISASMRGGGSTVISVDRAPLLPVTIGRQGENEFRSVAVDVSAWLALWPGGTISLVYERPDGMLYPVTTNGTASPVVWRPTAADTAVAGAGRLEVRLLQGDVIGKSCVIRTMVQPGLGAVGAAPVPRPDWVDDVLAAASGGGTARGAVLYGAEQSLDEAEKARARANIGAASEAELLAGGVTSVNGQTGAVTVSIPTALKNPQALTINGAVYDGSSAVSVTVDGADTVPGYVRAEAERVIAQVNRHATGRSLRFLAMADAHQYNDNAQITASNRHAGQAAKLIADRIGLDFACFLGDGTWGSAATTLAAGRNEIMTTNALLADAFRGLPQLRTPGNHDALGYALAQNGAYLKENELFNYFGRYCTDAVFGSVAGGYCYRDFANLKVRVICLNTADTSGTTLTAAAGAERVSDAQLDWFCRTLADVGSRPDAAQWSVILLSHHPADWGAVYPLANVIGAYETGGTVQPGSVSYSFQGKNAATIVAQFHGHVHCLKTDSIHTVSGGVGTATGIQRVAIPNMCYARNNEYGQNGKTEHYGIEFGEDTTWAKTANAAADTAFCVVTVDLDGRRIYADCYGAGYDRELVYLASSGESDGTGGAGTGSGEGGTGEGGGTGGTGGSSFTNLIPRATAYGSDVVYNGTGYKDGVYISSSGPTADGADAAATATGFIPYTVPTSGVPETIYIKGVTLGTDSHQRLYFADAAKSYVQLFLHANQSGSNAWDTYWTITKLGDQYYSLTPIAQGSSSVLLHTVSQIQNTQYIRFSFVGTGENLIVTVGEPIA